MAVGHFSISRKLTAGFACVLASAVVMAVAGFFATRAVDEAARVNAGRHNVVIDIERAAAAQYDQAHTARGFIITQAERHATLYAGNIQLFDRQIATARQDAAGDAAILAAIAGVEVANVVWRKEIGDPEIAFARDPKTLDKAVEIARSALSSEKMQGFRAALDKAREVIAAGAGAAEETQRGAMSFNKWTLVAGSFTSLALAVLVQVWLTRAISRPAHGIAAIMRRLAAGDNDIEVPVQSRADEFGEMSEAVRSFKTAALDRRRLEEEATRSRALAERERADREAEQSAVGRDRQKVVDIMGGAMERLAAGDFLHRIDFQGGMHEAGKLGADFNTAMEQLQQAMSTVNANANAIRSGTEEISTAAGDLSRRTEQQAAQLEEAASALGEITSMVRDTAERAGKARDIVSEAKSEAEKGANIVRNAVDAMSRIEESSQQIGRIIGVIDEIAFQTNLLALNAGVEAARAGEAGRGFAVVASEVRALAQRSADAAKEIKGLVSTSTAEVGQGVNLVDQTGHALERIAVQVSDLTTAVTRIAGSAHEQATGLDRVNVAVGELDQVTQQNAAMVEETTAAAHSLARETTELTALMGRFNLRDATDSAASRGASPRPVAFRGAEALRKPSAIPVDAHREKVRGRT